MALGNLDEIYRDDLILEHRRYPRNPDFLPNADIVVDGVNPFCGDEIHLQIVLDDQSRVSQVGFQGEGCSINQATGSMLSEAIKGLTLTEAEELSYSFHRMMQGPDPSSTQSGRPWRPRITREGARVSRQDQVRATGVVNP